MPPPPSPVTVSSDRDETPPATPGPKVPKIAESGTPRYEKARSGKRFKKTPGKLLRAAERAASAKCAPYAGRPAKYTPPREARPRTPPSAARGRPLSPTVVVRQPAVERPKRIPPSAARGILAERSRPETPPPEPRLFQRQRTPRRPEMVDASTMTGRASLRALIADAMQHITMGVVIPLPFDEGP